MENYAELVRSLNLTHAAPQALIKLLNAVEKEGLITIHDREGLTMWVNPIVDAVNYELREDIEILKVDDRLTPYQIARIMNPNADSIEMQAQIGMDHLRNERKAARIAEITL